MSESKECQFCAEEIKEAAKVCPHCRRTQRRDIWEIAAIVGIAFAVLYTIWKHFTYRITWYDLSFGFSITAFTGTMIVAGIIWALRQIFR